MKILCVDFGSTYTKCAAFDTTARKLLCTSQAFTTADTDVSVGLREATKAFKGISFDKRLACSSAAGGLRMLACGLVPSLTGEAAKRAALGAGAKVVKTYSYQLTGADEREIEALRPDIFLLTGGTDGGNRENILGNARALARIPLPFPVLIAGNRAASDECEEILRASCHPVYRAQNVMPELGRLEIDDAQRVIRDIFLSRIVLAKGLSAADDVRSDILMPTPAAVLSGLSLLSEKGMGELMALDLGGATTDVYSIASGAPRDASTLLHGLPEPYQKRTVEGDIGMRYSARGVAEAVGMGAVCALSELSESAVGALLQKIDDDKSRLPQTGDEQALDDALAALCCRVALARHCGTIRQVYTPIGAVYSQTGKDLTDIHQLVLTGGALIHSSHPEHIAQNALCGQSPEALTPKNARVLVDRSYILSSIGLLSGVDPDAAFDIGINIFRKENRTYGA